MGEDGARGKDWLRAGGITCVLQAKFSSFIFFFCHVYITEGATSVSGIALLLNGRILVRRKVEITFSADNALRIRLGSLICNMILCYVCSRISSHVCLTFSKIH